MGLIRGRILVTCVVWGLAVAVGQSAFDAKEDQADFCHGGKNKRLFAQTASEREIRTAYVMATLSDLVYYLPFKQQKQRLHLPGFHLHRRRHGVRSHFCRFVVVVRKFLNRYVFRRGSKTSISCLHGKERVVEFRYWFHGWFETTAIPGVNFHDTDLMIATQSKNTVVIAFSGTSSRMDFATNLQTFEKANHARLFEGNEGALHRGFLNAYSRVDRGHIHSLAPQNSTRALLLPGLDEYFHQCTFDRQRAVQDKPPLSEESSNWTRKSVTRKKRGGCFVRERKLAQILRQLVVDTLKTGKTVHISGHSLGGSLATLLAIDILTNFPNIPVRRLHLWTFGAPHIGDERFWQSLLRNQRLRNFVQKRFRRFVTMYDGCRREDFVSELTAQVLAGRHTFLRARLQRRLGGALGAVVHPMDAYYIDIEDSANVTALDAHSMVHYRHGLSRMSIDHPLSTDIPTAIWEET